jgi:hypothetical protein
MLIDVKSTSSRSFDKFKQGSLRDNDPFGYISQLSTYLYGSLDDPLVTNKTHAGFLAFDKQHGHIAVDIYDLTQELEAKEQEVQRKKDVVKLPEPPPRPKWENWVYNRSTKEYELVEIEEDWASGKSGNRKLSTNCSYCEFKNVCWPGLRTFVRANSVEHLTKVVKEPTGNYWEV